MGRQTAAKVEQFESQPATRASVEAWKIHAACAMAALHWRRVSLLRSDMGRDADRVQTPLLGRDKKVGGHARTPQPNLRVSGHSAPLFSTNRRQKTRAPGAQLVEFRGAVEGKQADPFRPSCGNIALALYRVAKGEPLDRAS